MTRPYTANDLRDDLSEILGQLKTSKNDNGETVARAHAAAALAKEIISSARAEIENNKARGDALPAAIGFIPDAKALDAPGQGRS